MEIFDGHLISETEDKNLMTQRDEIDRLCLFQPDTLRRGTGVLEYVLVSTTQRRVAGPVS